MTITLEELAQRLKALEEEVAFLRERVTNTSPEKSPAALASTAAKAHQESELPTEAPGIENLRAMLMAHGIYPGNEIVRQVIADMRDQDEEP